MFSIIRSFKPVWSLAAAAMAGALFTGAASAQSTNTDRLKAAIVFNVLRFVELPDSGRNALVFCVRSSDPSARSFQALSGRSAGSRAVTVRLLRAASFAGCDVAYLGSASASDVQSASANGRLLVGEGRQFIDHGGSIGLVQMGNQVRFEVNLEAAAASRVKMSSKLIRLAARVER